MTLNPLTRRPRRFAITGHEVQWTVGPTPVADAGELRAYLQRIRADRSTWQDDPQRPGTKKPMQIVIEPHAGTYHDDVAQTADAVRAAGFDEIQFAGGVRR